MIEISYRINVKVCGRRQNDWIRKQITFRIKREIAVVFDNFIVSFSPVLLHRHPLCCRPENQLLNKEHHSNSGSYMHNSVNLSTKDKHK